MAQTALISRLAITVLALVLPGMAWGQASSPISEILDSLPDDTRSQIASTGAGVDALRLLDALDVQGRHRFILPLPSSEAGPAAERLRDRLQEFGIRDGISSALAVHVNDATARADQLALQGDLARSERSRRSVSGLKSVLEPIRGSSSVKKPEWPWDNIRVSRATEPLSLLAWNTGAYSVATTPNFSIASQAGERPTAEMAQACELAYDIWSQLFATKLESEQINAPKLDSSNRQKPFRVVMFRTRDAYVQALRSIEPRIRVSTGYYSPRHQVSFFYWDGAKSLPTLVHELTHQFFQEWNGRGASFDADRDAGFWAVEGVALYVESFSMRKVGGAVVIDVGGWDSPRLQAGRYRRLHDEYWIAWEEFSQFPGDAFRNSKEIAEWYSQACGLVHRWLDGSDQDFQRFSKYLARVYDGQGSEAAWQLSKDDESMRGAYDDYLLTSWRKGDGGGTRPFFPNRREAVLARCETSSQDLLAWPVPCRAMDWLDLSFSRVDDRWLIDAENASWQIARLNLESTATTDASLGPIAAMKELRELDLTHCQVTDEGIGALQGHPNLRQLWLGHTKITDASIKSLLSLPRLERLTVEGSGISDQGWKQILAKKPFLKR